MAALGVAMAALAAYAGTGDWFRTDELSIAVLLVLYEILRGWRRGGARQLTRLGALVAAYFAAYFGGKYLLPLARPFLK